MPRKLFCEISPTTYRISVRKNILQRMLKDAWRKAGGQVSFARERSAEPLPVCVYAHRSLIRRRLGNVDMELQENKAVNLALAAPKVNGILMARGDLFFLASGGQHGAEIRIQDGPGHQEWPYGP